MATERVLEVRDLSVAYGKVEAVSNANLDVEAGQIVTVIGPNGAGKTTLLAAIMGALPSNGTARGVVRFGGVVEPRPSVESMVARGMTLVPEKRELFGEMTVEDNLVLGAFQRYRSGQRDHPQTMGEVYTLFPRLQERRTQLAGTLSGGERQMLAVGRALMAKPRLLMLDEPSLGLAPIIAEKVLDTLERINEDGVAILLVEQNIRDSLNIANRAYVLEEGKIIIEGEGRELLSNSHIKEVYLGV